MISPSGEGRHLLRFAWDATEAFGHIPTMVTDSQTAKIEAVMEDCTETEFQGHTVSFNHPNEFIVRDGDTVAAKLYVNLSRCSASSSAESLDSLIREYEETEEPAGRWRNPGAEVDA